MTKARINLEKYEQFRFDTGSLALNLVATVRHRGSQPRDLLVSAAAFDQWLKLAGLPPCDTESSAEEFHNMLLLRECIYRVVQGLVTQSPTDDADYQLINSCAAFPVAAPQISHETQAVVWLSERPVRAGMSLIARDAVLLIGNIDRNRLKMCVHDDCQMLFVDLSPRNQRRWCSMSVCGNREKVAAYRQRNNA